VFTCSLFVLRECATLSRSGLGDFGVAEYRAYTVGIDGHFIGFEPLVCADDSQAIDNAKRMAVESRH
jgi:hypothetical protein